MITLQPLLAGWTSVGKNDKKRNAVKKDRKEEIPGRYLEAAIQGTFGTVKH